jgi:hypothetical protein
MRSVTLLLTAAVVSVVALTHARADCQIADAKLEEAILKSPNLRGPVNRQAVRDLRSLREAAITLRSYGRHDDCERLLGNIRELIAAPPPWDRWETTTRMRPISKSPRGSQWFNAADS